MSCVNIARKVWNFIQTLTGRCKHEAHFVNQSTLLCMEISSLPKTLSRHESGGWISLTGQVQSRCH